MADDPQNDITSLYRDIETLLDTLQIPAEERTQVEQSLMEAVAADLLMNLGNRLSEDERIALVSAGRAEEGSEPNLASLADFFKDKFTEAELIAALRESTESVLRDFAKELGT